MADVPIIAEFANHSAGAKAREYVVNNGVPNRRNEEYHFTDLARGLGEFTAPQGEVPVANLKAEIVIHSTKFGDIVSGKCDGVVIENLPEPPSQSHIGALLCAGLAQSVSRISIAANTNVRIAIQRGAGSRSAVELEIGENANVQIIEEQAANGGFSSNLVNANLAKGAKLRRIMLMNTIGAKDMRFAEINLAEGASLDLFALCFGGELVRIDTVVNLNGEGAKANINAAYLLNHSQNDLTTKINHNAAHCESHEVVRGIANAKSRGVFQGLIKVAKDAQKTIGNMEHRAIMLEEGAGIYAKPCLEIYADDVECSHANAIGALDDKALFYMQSRGISKSTGKLLLTKAFIAEVFDDLVDDELHAEVLVRIEEKLGAML